MVTGVHSGGRNGLLADNGHRLGGQGELRELGVRSELGMNRTLSEKNFEVNRTWSELNLE